MALDTSTSTRPPLDPASRQVLDLLAASGRRPLEEGTAEDARALAPARIALNGEGPAMADVRDLTVPADDGHAVPVRVFVPEQPPRGTAVYLHGGAWVVGSIAESDTFARRLAAASGYVVVAVDYRLAPEHPHPAAVLDTDAVVRWAAEQREAHGLEADAPLVLLGDSAGGNLATVAARRARDQGGPGIAMQVLVYPVADADTATASYLDPANQLLVSRSAMEWAWDQYVPDAAARRLPDVSPLQTEDLAGMPPTVLITAGYDPLLDEGLAYARRLRDAGVEVDLLEHPDQMHGFVTMLALPGSAVAMDQIVAELERAADATGSSR
ncbi:alpha/beta hydrolase [Modestobacter versicolor]|uniref:Acetyl esterase n=1 Tax=Modestobacter versicolor TaxID=429133 RepID=A0A323VDD4_9ACTN|nr:alpha/beta hydrolase [Modestobacter versicolor]MBB3675840.1 acetyl esterase [Modestobacter versicolor]PZA22844.1 alpha/beta hydrolase [Modestobacter versicolor]